MSLILKNIVKEFAPSTLRAVDDVSLDFQKGKFHTLLGPSGCGKTTLLRMIAGFEKPSSGEIIFNGQKINDVPAQERGFSMVFQSYALFPHMNVRQNIGYGLKIKKLSRQDAETRVQKAISMLDLNGQDEKYPSQMSGGQQQRVALARAMVMEPKIILFDEPLSNLDAKLRLHMRTEIRALQQRLGITAIYVTHDQEEAMAISDQIVVLNKGRIEQIDSPLEIYRKPKTEFVARFLGGANVLKIDQLSSVKFQFLGRDFDFVEASPPKESLQVVVRPESIRVTRTSGRHCARVEASTFLGAKVSYSLDCAGVKLSSEMPWSANTEIFKAGDDVTLDVESSSLHLI